MRLEIETDIASPHIVQLQPNVGEPGNVTDVSQTLTRGIAAARSGNRALARTLLFEVTESDPGSSEAWLWLASISEYPEELLGFLDNVIAVEPNNRRALEWKTATQSLLAKTFVQRGSAALDEGSTDFAEECFNNAITNDPQCEAAWLGKASIASDDLECIECCERALKINAENSEARDLLFTVFARQNAERFLQAQRAAVRGDWNSALTSIDEILHCDPSHLEAWALRSHVAPSIDQKILAFDRMLEIDPNHPFATNGRDFLTAAIDSVRAQSRIEEPSETITPSPADVSAVPFDDSRLETSSPSLDEVINLLGVSDGDEHGKIFDSANEIESLQESRVSDVRPPDRSPRANIRSTETTIAEKSTEQTLGTPCETNEFSEAYTAEYVNAELASYDPFSETVTATSPPLSNDSSEEPDDEAAYDFSCPFCMAGNEPQAFTCRNCHGLLTVSDIEALLADSNCNRTVMQMAVSQIENGRSLDEFGEDELATLGIGYFNLNQPERGFIFLQEASRRNPNNVILAGQVNALAIRLEDLRRQLQNHESMPKGKTILVVDDSATVRKLISSKLEKSGHKVIMAVDGVEAIDMLAEVVPDLVLLDIAMPRMDGYSVCKIIRSNDAVKNVPVVMISGKDGFFDKVRGRMAGTTGYITKPFGPETLMRALETYLLPDQDPANAVSQ